MVWVFLPKCRGLISFMVGTRRSEEEHLSPNNFGELQNRLLSDSFQLLVVVAGGERTE